VSNRESFEALPGWLEELEKYVPPEVVKIVVGNKLDMVRARPLVCIPADHAQEYSRQVPTDEGAAFAQFTGCLFVEASAKTAAGVTEAFRDVVERIIDTPALWVEEKEKEKASSSSSKARAATSVPGYRAQDRMQGIIDLSQAQEGDDEADARGWCRC
jgi:Ras-related protein Rab-18